MVCLLSSNNNELYPHFENVSVTRMHDFICIIPRHAYPALLWDYLSKVAQACPLFDHVQTLYVRYSFWDKDLLFP